MTSIAVKDLKKPKELRDTLAREHEILVTKDGRPFAVMIEVDAETAEEKLRDVRRALFSASIMSARRRAVDGGMSMKEIDTEITSARESRKS